MTEEEAVLGMLEEYAEAYCSKDIDRLMVLFDDGDDISLIGTGSDELCAGRSDIKAVFLRNFSEATATRFQWHWKHVTLTDGYADRCEHLDYPPGHPGWLDTGSREMDRLVGTKVWPVAVVT